MLIPSLYATSLCTRSLKAVRVPSDQNTRWRLPFPHSTDKRQEFLVLPISWFPVIQEWNIIATPHMCDRMTTPLETMWTKLRFYLIIMFYCVVCALLLICICSYALILYIFVHALYKLLYASFTCLGEFILKKFG